jgi:hypothetical protein
MNGSVWTAYYNETGTAAVDRWGTEYAIQVSEFQSNTQRIYTLPPATKLVIRYGGSGGRWRLNATGAWTNLSTASGITGAVTVYNSTRATQTLAIDNGNGGTNGSFILAGIDVFDNDELGVKIYNFGNTGAMASTTRAAANYASTRGLWASYQPALVVINFGVNDIRNGTISAATFKTTLQNLIADIKESVVAAGGAGGISGRNPSFVIMMPTDTSFGTTPIEAWATYIGKAWEIASADPNNVTVFQQGDIIGSAPAVSSASSAGVDEFWKENAAPYTGTYDYIHYGPNAQRAIAQAFSTFLGSPPTTTGIQSLLNSGVALPARPQINVTSTFAQVFDDAANNRTLLSIPSPIYAPPTVTGGQVSPPHTNSSTNWNTRGQVRYGRVYLDTTVSYSGMNYRSAVEGVGTTVRCAVYTENNGGPATKIAATELSFANPAAVNTTPSFAGGNWTPPYAGWYWLAVALDGGTGEAFTMVVVLSTQASDQGGGFPQNAAGSAQDFIWTTGTLPTLAYAGGPTTLINSMPGIALRRA